MAKKIALIALAAALVATLAFAVFASTIPGEKISNTLTASITAKEDKPSGGSGSSRRDTEPEPPAPEEESEEALEFSDVSGHWAEDVIYEFAKLGIINGYPDGTFRPDQTVTRAEWVRMMALAIGLDPVEGVSPFADPIPDWAEGYVTAAYEAGLTKGYPDGTFRPNDSITREQLAVFAARIHGGGDPEYPLLFADAPNISSWARESVAAVVSVGIMEGYPDNTFHPHRSTTRAEALVVLSRILSLLP